MPTPPPVLTMREAALYLRLSERTLHGLVQRKAVPSFRLGRQHRFNLAALEQWAREQSGRRVSE